MTAPDPRNTFTGSSCAEFGEHMANTGVYDASGQNHPGRAGATPLDPTKITGGYQWTAQVANVWTCPTEPDTYYESQAECERNSPCKPGLGGSMIKCGGFVGKVVTARPYLEPIDLSFTALRWRPERPVSPECQAAIDAFDRAVDAHEQRHVDDLRRIINAEMERLAKLTLKALGKDTEEARERIRKQLADLVTAAQEAITKAYAKSIDDFHQTPEGQQTTIDCTACG
ncbi:hypothetical protein [Cumulibacter soli]|uniref:hypothetical protein n=1 Tax=Cumulibacter soli TaxID=2546344 RepID=UPI00106866A0|nr:hypothetical protein [Cumulibacter soli]